MSGFGVEAAQPLDSQAARSFSRALWAQALFAGTALVLASSNPATFNLASSNPVSLGLLLVAGALAGLILSATGKRLSRRAELGLALAAFLFVPVDIFGLGAELASAFARALLVLQLAKLLGPRTRRDESTILTVALVHVAVAASSTVEVSFLPVLLGYAATAGYALSVRELRGSPVLGLPAAAPVTRGFRFAQLGIATATLAIAAGIFITMPRIGAKLLPGARTTPERLSGFTDTIQLDQTGRIRESQKLAFRAVIVERGKLAALPYWRGRALDVYDGSRWSNSLGIDRLGRQFTSENGVFDMPLHPSRSVDPATLRRATVLDITLEPMATVTVFAPGVVHRLDFKTAPPPILYRDALGTIQTFTFHLSETAYRVTCSPEVAVPRYGLSGRIDALIRAHCTELPESVDRERLAAYATRVLTAAGLRRDSPASQIARALEDHVGSSFKYTLDAPHEEGAERVSEFLFKTKVGHCEIFASALALLLRSIGVPARVVNGYKGGEYHSWSDSYTVRERHAHSWVEALTENGWTTVDATPAIDTDDEGTSRIAQTFEDAREWLEIRWFRDVIAFDQSDQSSVARWMSGAVDPKLENLDSWKQAGHEMLERGGRRDLGIIAGILAFVLVLGTAGVAVGPRALLAALAAWLSTLVGRRPAGRAVPAATRELELLVRALAARGVVRKPGETARELAARAVQVLGPGAAPVESVVPFYYEARYGGRELTAEERGAIALAARALAGSPKA